MYDNCRSVLFELLSERVIAVSNQNIYHATFNKT